MVVVLELLADVACLDDRPRTLPLTGTAVIPFPFVIIFNLVGGGGDWHDDLCDFLLLLFIALYQICSKFDFTLHIFFRVLINRSLLFWFFTMKKSEKKSQTVIFFVELLSNINQIFEHIVLQQYYRLYIFLKCQILGSFPWKLEVTFELL